MTTSRSKPRGLYYADETTRQRVARSGGKARAEKIAKMKASQGAR